MENNIELNDYWASIIIDLNEFDCKRKNISDRQSRQDNLKKIRKLALKKNKSILDVQNFYRLFELRDLSDGLKERFFKKTFSDMSLSDFYDSFDDLNIPIYEDWDCRPSLIFNRFSHLNYFEIRSILDYDADWNDVDGIRDRIKEYVEFGLDRYSSYVGTVNFKGTDITVFDIAGAFDLDYLGYISSFYAGVSFFDNRLTANEFFELKPSLKSELKKDNNMDAAYIRIAIFWIETIRNYESYAIISSEKKRYMSEALKELRSSINWYEFPLSTKMIDTLIDEILNFDFGDFDLINFIKFETRRKLFSFNEVIVYLREKLFQFEFDEKMIEKMNDNSETIVLEVLQKIYPNNHF